MSHASGAIKFEDGEIWFYEYNGTADVCVSHIYRTLQEVKANWKKGEWLYCECGKEEPVVVYTNYGGGWHMNGKACRNCNSLSCDTSPGYWFYLKDEERWELEYFPKDDPDLYGP